MLARLSVFLLCLLTSGTVWACQAMKEVWYPNGVIPWGETQTTADILDGFFAAVRYYESRTPIVFNRVQGMSKSGMAATDQIGALEVRYTEHVSNRYFGGMTPGYWDRMFERVVLISFQNVKTREAARDVLAHELGHVLGFTHEFQRLDRKDNGVSLDPGLAIDPFNASIPSPTDVRILSPYDIDSRWAVGYNGVNPPHLGPDASLLSKHDINCLYRVYGRPLGALNDGILFGEAAATGDFDRDGIEDLAIAAQYFEPASDFGVIYFFKGVAQDNQEDGTGTTYVPWFREAIAFEKGQKRQIVLTTGDTHSLTGPTTVEDYADGVQELIIGLPGAARVEIWVINGDGRFADKLGPQGAHGVGKKIRFSAADVGIKRGFATSEFGASLATGRFFNRSGDDLAIGAPGAMVVTPVGANAPPHTRGKGPAVFLLPDADPSKAIRLESNSGDPADRFGASLAVMKEFDRGQDTLAVGAPGNDATSGRVFIFKRAPDSATAPRLHQSFGGGGTGGGFGTTLLTFTTREAKSATPVHWIAVGAPTAAAFGSDRTGAVDLYSVDPNSVALGSRRLEFHLRPPTRQEGMHFGRSLAVQQGSCTSDICPKQQTRIAIGSPQASFEGKKTGMAFLWKVWNNGNVMPIIEEPWAGMNDDSRYGQDLISVRRRQEGGGFLVLGKNTALPGFTQVPGPRNTTIPKPTTLVSGFGELRLNRSASSARWIGWVKQFSPATPADSPPGK